MPFYPPPWSSRDDDSSTEHLIKGTSHDEEEYMQTKKFPRKAQFTFVLQVTSQILMVALCLLLTLNLVLLHRNRGNTITQLSDSDRIFLHYSEKLDYQTLDHKHDHLWNVMSTEVFGLVKMNDPMQGNKPEGGLISM